MPSPSFVRVLEQFFEQRFGENAGRSRPAPPSTGGPVTFTRNLASIAVAGAGQTQIAQSGYSVLLDPDSHAGARLEIAFDAPSANAWQPLTPGKIARPRDGRQFLRFYVRKRSTVPAALDAEPVYLVVDPGEVEGTYEPNPRTAQLTDEGSANTLMRATTLAGDEVPVVASDEGALAGSGWDGAAYQRLRTFGAALADAFANPGAGVQQVGSFLFGWNGATWDRIKLAALNSNPNRVTDKAVLTYTQVGGVSASSGVVAPVNATDSSSDAETAFFTRLKVDAVLRGFNGATWDRLRSGIGSPGTGVLRTDEATCPDAPVTRGSAAAAAADALAANTNRDSLTIQNLDAVEDIYVRFGADASAAAGWKIGPGDSLGIRTTQRVSVIRGGGTDADYQIVEQRKA